MRKYKVLLADDELIILSGIRYLIDWDAQNCEIVMTAHNGQETLDAIRDLHPDIVVCDINMPLRSGLDVLEDAQKYFPGVAFIMLTNYQEFGMVQRALRHDAVDYLLKTQLDPQMLIQALQRAKATCQRKDSAADENETSEPASMQGLLAHVLRECCLAPDDLAFLRQNGFPASYHFLLCNIDLSTIPNIASFSMADRVRTIACERDIIAKIVQSAFPSSLLLEAGLPQKTLAFFLPNVGEADFTKAAKTLDDVSARVTQARVDIAITDRFQSPEQLCKCALQAQNLFDIYYCSVPHFLCAGDVRHKVFEPFKTAQYVNLISSTLVTFNPQRINSQLDQVINMLRTTEHRRMEGISLCSSTVGLVLPLVETAEPMLFSRLSSLNQRIYESTTRDELIAVFEAVSQELMETLVKPPESPRSIIDRTVHYVETNLHQRILLSEAADVLKVSPNYLSSLFKKQMGCSFIEYVNRKKIERACELIDRDEHHIYEIAFMLGFDSPYYFSKVFKRITNVSPSEYRIRSMPDGS